MTTTRRLAYSALILNTIIWGAALPIIKPVFAYLTPVEYLYLRFLVAGLISLPIFLYYYFKLRPKISYIFKVMLVELLGLPLPLIILYTGLSKTSALEASLIGSTGPIFIILAGMYFLHDRESRREWQGLGLSLLGSSLIILEPLWNGHGFAGSSLTGNLYILAYNLLYTVYVITAKKIYKTKPPLYLGSLTYLGTAMIYGLILSSQHSLPLFENLRIWDLRIILPVLYMAIPGGIIAFALQLYGMSKIEVSEAHLFTYLHGVVAIPAAYFLLGEVPSFTSLYAILIIALGVYTAELRKS